MVQQVGPIVLWQSEHFPADSLELRMFESLQNGKGFGIPMVCDLNRMVICNSST